MPNLQGVSPIGRGEGDRSCAAPTVREGRLDRQRHSCGGVLGVMTNEIVGLILRAMHAGGRPRQGTRARAAGRASRAAKGVCGRPPGAGCARELRGMR